MSKDVLIVDDDKNILDLVSSVLEDAGHTPRCASNSDSALNAIASRCPSLVLLDVVLEESTLSGLEILNLLHERHPHLPVIMISGQGTVETAFKAVKAGAYDYIEKPFKSDKLLSTIAHAIETAQLRHENEDLRRRAGVQEELIGRSTAIERLNTMINKVAPTNSRIWITGAVGSGKELVARLIHARSSRSQAPFLAINAAVLELQNMEALLFGRETEDEIETGVFERAHSGTLYLDEVGDMPNETQAKILRILLDQKFTRIGGQTQVQVDVRVISSSSNDPRQLTLSGELRKDLFHRLSVVPLKVPSLKERRDDIPSLVDYFIRQISAQLDIVPRLFSTDAMAILQSYEWPGNVRQLRNALEYILINSPSQDETDDITLEMIPADVLNATDLNGTTTNNKHMMTMSLKDAREIFEREYLVAQIGRFSGNISRTAEFIGMERSALHRKLKSLGVHTERARHAET